MIILGVNVQARGSNTIFGNPPCFRILFLLLFPWIVYKRRLGKEDGERRKKSTYDFQIYQHVQAIAKERVVVSITAARRRKHCKKKLKICVGGRATYENILTLDIE